MPFAIGRMEYASAHGNDEHIAIWLSAGNEADFKQICAAGLLRTGNYPGWMKLLGKWDMMFRKGVFKLPMSHLFYVLRRKM